MQNDDTTPADPGPPEQGTPDAAAPDEQASAEPAESQAGDDAGATGDASDSNAQATDDQSPAEVMAEPAEAADDIASGVSEQLGEFTSSVQEFVKNPTLDNAVDAFLPPLMAIGEAIIVLVIIVVVTALVSRWVHSVIAATLRKTKLEETVANFIALIAKYAVWILAIPIALGFFGIPATSLAAVIGAAGLAIGLGLQGSLSNIAAGIMLLVLRPMKISDFVQIGNDDLGVVKDVGIFYSIVNTFNDVLVYIPNAEILSSRIENLTGNRARRVDVPVGVAYGSDLREAERVLTQAAGNDIPNRWPHIDPRVYLTAFADSSINFEVQVWCDARDFLRVRHETIHAIDESLAAAGITIAFPQRDLHFPDTLRIARADTRRDRRPNTGDPSPHADAPPPSPPAPGGSDED